MTDTNSVKAAEVNAARPRWFSKAVLGFGLASLLSDAGHEAGTAALPALLVSLGALPAALGLIEGIADGVVAFAKLYGGTDVHWAEKARADFSTAVLTPESPLQPSVPVSDDEDDSWDVDLPAWANIAVANATADRRQAAPRPAMQGQAPMRAAPGAVLEAPPPAERNNLERRRSDRGPPPGQPDRRQVRSFGRRPTH